MSVRAGVTLTAVLCALSAACGDDTDVPSPDAGDDGIAGNTAGAPGMAGSGGAGASGGVAGKGGAGGMGDRSVSFKKDVAPIFESRCVTCHHAGSIIGLDLHNPFDSEHGLIDLKNSWAIDHDSPYEWVVVPGDPDASFLIYKVAGDPDNFDIPNNGDPMPMHLPRMSEQELSDIAQWITDGAHEDAQFDERVAPLFGTQITLGRRSGRCTYCHYPESPTGLNILAVFDTTTGLVGAGSNFSSKLRVAPGDPEGSFLLDKLMANPGGGQQMPLHPPRLGAAEVDTLRAWIRGGALND